jgi:hypothetical protein
MVESRGEKLLTRALPAALALVIAGSVALEKAGISIFSSDSKASGNVPAKTAGSITVESTMNGISGGQSIDVTCSGFNERVTMLAQGQGFSVVLGQIRREAGVTDGAIVDAIEEANGLDGEMAQPDVAYQVPTDCAIKS